MSELGDIVKEFLVESTEAVDELDEDLATLKDAPSSELLAKVFRCMHTIKGSCGFLEFSRLERLTHKSENALSQLRDGKRQVTPSIVDLLVDAAADVRRALAVIETNGGREGDDDFAPIVAQLEDWLTRSDDPPASLAAPTPSHPEKDSRKESRTEDEPDAASGVPDRRPLGEILIARGLVRPEDVVLALQEQRRGDPRHLGELLVEKKLVSASQVRDALKAQGADRPTGLSENSIRVDVNLLDNLMNLAGELVLARNQIQQFTSEYQNRGFLNSCARLNLITTELQARVMQTRMQPIGNVWSKFPRLLRRLASVCEKQVRLEMDGKETELDKTILEAIKDPLTHFIRNSVDHGIEPPAERVAKGKSPEGTVFLRAVQEGGQVILEVADDGRGIPVDRIRDKALEKGLINAVQAARMPDREILDLIFVPGFSTAESVTNVSGRGVGMDVVKTNIERVGGNVTVHTEPGAGTTFKIKIPLTLAIIPALLVSSGGWRYALPQVSLLELVRLEANEAKRRIEYIHANPVYRLRGRLLPLVYLNRELGLESPGEPATSTNIVVLHAGDRDFGLVVDTINDTAEIVVKPLGKQLKKLSAFAGATILGDGTVALILDVLGLAQRASVISEVQDRRAAGEDAEAPASETERLLVFQVGDRRLAVAVSTVSRLEEIRQSSVERSHGRDVVQYRGSILPLCRLGQILGQPVASTDGSETLSVLVHDTEGGAVGLVVDRVVDIVDETPIVQQVATEEWLLGSGIVQGQVTDFLDIHRLVASRGIAWLAPPAKIRMSA